VSATGGGTQQAAGGVASTGHRPIRPEIRHPNLAVDRTSDRLAQTCFKSLSSPSPCPGKQTTQPPSANIGRPLRVNSAAS
jgi:hypothetical protein